MNGNTQTQEAKRIIHRAAKARKKLQRALETPRVAWSKIDGLEKTLRRMDAEALAMIDAAADAADPEVFNALRSTR